MERSRLSRALVLWQDSVYADLLWRVDRTSRHLLWLGSRMSACLRRWLSNVHHRKHIQMLSTLGRRIHRASRAKTLLFPSQPRGAFRSLAAPVSRRRPSTRSDP